MKNSGKCSKCQSNGIMHVPALRQLYGGGNIIELRPSGKWLSWEAPVMVSRYVCDKCGFCEEWIDNAGDIAKLKKLFGG